MVRSEGLEPPTPWFEAKYSIQLSYERFLDMKAYFKLFIIINKIVTYYMKVSDCLCKIMVGRVRIELTTQRLKAFCSTD